MSESLKQLLRLLQLAGLDVDAEAALDGVWLALRMHERATAPAAAAARTSTAGDAGTTASSTSTIAETGAGSTTATAPARDTPFNRSGEFARRARPTPPAAPSRALTLPRAAALPESRSLIKSLRPLRRRVVSPGSGLLDVDATVRSAAEEDLWIPSFESARERWLDVLLVADHGLSMILWKDTIDEFERVLRNSGAFRSVRSWWLESDETNLAITPRGRGPRPAKPEELVRLVRGQARSLILVISDCVGARWHDGAIPRLMAKWSHQLPLALLQVTPEWFWARTALGDTVGCKFQSAVPAAVNRRLRIDAAMSGLGDRTEVDGTFLRLPAAPLSAAALGRVAGLVAGASREWAPGVIFDLTWEGEEAPPAAAVSAGDRVTRFRALASKSAHRLAACYAASPVRSLGILRLLRRDLLPEAGPFTEAEVLLGGIVRVRKENARWERGAALELEFFPGVQPLLLDGAVAADVVRVLMHAAQVAESGVVPTFTSWLEDPSSGVAQLDPATSAFATAAAESLARLGGSYARLVRPDTTATSAATGDEAQTTPGADTEKQSAAPDEAAESDSTGASPTTVGRPHTLPLDQTFVGRTAALARVDQWLTEKSARPVLALVGPKGIGKTALAARATLDWETRWPNEPAFVWSCRSATTFVEVLGAFRHHYGADGHDQPAESKEKTIFPEIARRMRSLVVFDGVDALNDTERQRVMSLAGEIAQVSSARVLVTARQLQGADLLRLEPLAQTEVEVLVKLMVAHAGVATVQSDPLPEVTRIARLLGGGNPQVVRFLVSKALELSARVLVEEIVEGNTAFSSIDPDQLPVFDELFATAMRARELSAKGASLVEAGDMQQAFKSFDDVVALRAKLPSILLRGRALHDRGRTALAVAEYDRANADLADAIGLFRRVAADRERMGALEAIAEVRVAMKRDAEATSNLREALDLARKLDDHAAAFRVLLRLATLSTQRGTLEEAMALLSEAMDAARRTADTRTIGLAHLQRARLRMQLGDVDAALADGRAAVERFQTAGDEALTADALQEVATLENAAGAGSAVLEKEYVISGRVQGVSFRSFAQQWMRELELVGTAENLADGRVRVRARGPAPQLDALESRLRSGPPASNVAEVTVRVVDALDTRAAPRPVLRRGATGELVLELQRKLGVPADGVYGAQTESRVREFQRAHGVAADGIVGPRTWSALDAVAKPVRSRPASPRGGTRTVIAIGVDRVEGLPVLRAAAASAKRLGEWAMVGQRIARERVSVFTDDNGRQVRLDEILDAIGTCLQSEDLDQLIVYFAGHGASVARQDTWLLSGASVDAHAIIGLAHNVELARYSGIPHVVFISDTSRTTDASHVTRGMPGAAIFPNIAKKRQGSAVDRFFATSPEQPAYEVRATSESSESEAVFTTVLLSALSGHETSVQQEQDGRPVITSRSLARFLRAKVPERMASYAVSLQQQPEIIVESEEDCWLASFDAPDTASPSPRE